MDELQWTGAAGEVKDETGVNHGTAYGGATTTSDAIYGRAGYFDGIGGYVDCGKDDSLDITDAITVEAWVNTNSQGEYRKIATKGNASDSSFYFSQGLGSHKTYFGVRNQDSDVKHAVYDQYLPIGEWVHLVGTYDGSSVNLYWNGILVATEPHSGLIYTNNYPVRISGYTTGGEIFDGIIDEFRIYNRALTPTEVQILSQNYMQKMGSYFNVRKYVTPAPVVIV